MYGTETEIIIAIVAAVVIAGLVFWFWKQKKNKRIQASRDKLDAEEADIEKAVAEESDESEEEEDTKPVDKKKIKKTSQSPMRRKSLSERSRGRRDRVVKVNDGSLFNRRNTLWMLCLLGILASIYQMFQVVLMITLSSPGCFGILSHTTLSLQLSPLAALPKHRQSN